MDRNIYIGLIVGVVGIVAVIGLAFGLVHILNSKNRSSETLQKGLSPCLQSLENDGYCDDVNNHDACNFDGGDCCGDNVDTTFCHLCDCLDPDNGGSNASTWKVE